MNTAFLSPEEADNLEATYLAIGGASPDSRIELREGYSLCLGRLDHPIGNFGIIRVLKPFTAGELAAEAKGRKSFNVYVPSSAASAESVRALRACGFRPSYRLTAMRASPQESASDCALHLAENADGRLRVALFMVRQFFPNQESGMRGRIAQATADCGLDLYEILRYGTLVGAAMISRGARLFGIYNLCIDEERRGQGLGSDALARLLSLAANEGSDAVLQADPSLESWYVQRGFRTTGAIEVFK